MILNFGRRREKDENWIIENVVKNDFNDYITWEFFLSLSFPSKLALRDENRFIYTVKGFRQMCFQRDENAWRT